MRVSVWVTDKGLGLCQLRNPVSGPILLAKLSPSDLKYPGSTQPSRYFRYFVKVPGCLVKYPGYFTKYPEVPRGNLGLVVVPGFTAR